MSSVKFPIIGGETMRVTIEDRCGVPAWGDKTQIVSDGFVSVAVTANYDDGTEISVKNANGRRCVQRDARAELVNESLDVVFCAVDPDLYTAVTGYPKIIDPATGNTIGFRVNSAVLPDDHRWGLEVWSDAQGTVACDEAGDVPYGYELWPMLSGGRLSDYTIEENAVTFGISGALTKKGSQWDRGPYEVTTDETGAPDVLQDPITADDHQHVQVTTVPPPEPTDGLIPLDDPDQPPATGASAGIPGTWSPAGAVRPYDLAELAASAITATPTSAWTTGQHVILGDGSTAHWDGTDWVAGPA